LSKISLFFFLIDRLVKGEDLNLSPFENCKSVSLIAPNLPITGAKCALCPSVRELSLISMNCRGHIKLYGDNQVEILKELVYYHLREENAAESWFRDVVVPLSHLKRVEYHEYHVADKEKANVIRLWKKHMSHVQIDWV